MKLHFIRFSMLFGLLCAGCVHPGPVSPREVFLRSVPDRDQAIAKGFREAAEEIEVPVIGEGADRVERIAEGLHKENSEVIRSLQQTYKEVEAFL